MRVQTSMTVQKSLIGLVLGLLLSPALLAAPSAEYWRYWDTSSEGNYRTIDHSAWSSILSRYVVTQHTSGINRFRYGDVSKDDRKRLQSYIDAMAAVDPRTYRKLEQKAYWMNFYNALVVNLVVQHYPIKSVQDIKGKGFSKGPWDTPLVTVAQQELSLNDIEHRILRPIWKDHKIHFGLACASLGCPSLQAQAFTAQNHAKLLKKTGQEFVNHDRGVSLSKGKLEASSIFDWYQKDFAKSEKSLLKVFAHYSDDRQALYLLGFSGDIKFRHDWALNGP
ncbi:MAG: DUF547 domain-containing protein [Porticoccaceae bacterium]